MILVRLELTMERPRAGLRLAGSLSFSYSLVYHRSHQSQFVPNIVVVTCPCTDSFHGPINYYRASAQLPTKFSKTKLKVSGFTIWKFRTDLFRVAKVPVLSIFGTGDKYITVAAAKNTPNYVEDCTEVYLEGISHFSMMDAPQQVNKEIEQYLKKRDL